MRRFCTLLLVVLTVAGCRPLTKSGDSAAEPPLALADQPQVWGGRSLLGDRERGNLNTFLEEVAERTDEETRTVTVQSHLGTVLLNSETLLPGYRKTQFTYGKDTFRYRGTPHPGSSVAIEIRGDAVRVELGGPLARAGHHIPERMPSPVVVDEELMYSLQELVRYLYPDTIPRQPESEPRTVEAIVPSLRAVRKFSSQVVQTEVLQLATGPLETTQLRIEVADSRRIQLDLWFDESRSLVHCVRVWGNGVHRSVAYHLGANPGSMGAAIDQTPLRRRLRGSVEGSIDPLVWIHADQQRDRRLVNRLLFELVPHGVAMYPVAAPAGRNADAAISAAMRDPGSRTLVLHGRALHRFVALYSTSAERFSRVILVHPERWELSDAGLRAMVSRLRERPLFVVWGEEDPEVAAFVATLRPKLPRARWHGLPGIDAELRARRLPAPASGQVSEEVSVAATYPDPLPTGFAAALQAWLSLPIPEVSGAKE
ncbi:MAG: hypothetical protein AAF581_02665 [Planctomycetota bacterium]